MPMIDLTVVRGSVPPEALGQLADDLVGLLLAAEGAEDTPFLREHTWVYVHEVEPSAVLIGGRVPGQPRFRVDLSVFEGMLTKETKEQLARQVHAAVCRAAGLEPKGERALHVWTLIHEIPDGSWAAGGRIAYRSAVEGLRTS